MFAPNNSAPVDQMPKVPFDIHASLVASLFDDARSLIIGSVAATACIFLSAWKAGSWVLLGFARCRRHRRGAARARHERVREDPVEPENCGDVRRWEIRYVVGATCH